MFNRMRVVVFVFLLVLGLGLSSNAQGVTEFPIIQANGMPAGVYLEIDPRIELLAGVLSHTSWINMMGPAGARSEYFQALQAFFKPYVDHPAIKLAEELTKLGFTYDAPPNFMLSSGQLPELSAPAGGYSSYLVGRARSADRLENFRKALADLAQVSGFAQFYAVHSSEYQRMVDEAAAGVDAMLGQELEWAWSFFGSAGDEIHMVLAPAMFAGGFGSRTLTPDGKWRTNEVLSVSPKTYGWPTVFDDKSLYSNWLLNNWEAGVFIQPALAKHWDLATQLKLEDIVVPVRSVMASQKITTGALFFEKQLLRAINSLAMQKLYGDAVYRQHVFMEIAQGFFLTPLLTQELERYQANRASYPTFDAFVPELFRRLYAEKGALLDLINQSLSLQSKGAHEEARQLALQWMEPTKPAIFAFIDETPKQKSFTFDIEILPVDGYGDVASVQVDVDGQPVQFVPQPPVKIPVSIDTSSLQDGKHALTVTATGKNQSVTKVSSTFLSLNWQKKLDLMDQPLKTPYLGVADFSKVSSASSGWQYAIDPKALFGDTGRRARVATTSEYLVWDAPHLRAFAITLYVAQSVADQIAELVELSTSTAQNDSDWQRLQHTVEAAEKADGWVKLVLKGETPDLPDRLKLAINGSSTADAIQVGEVELMHRRW